MFDWKILAVITPLFFAAYQALSKLLPKGTSVFLVNAYAALVGLIFMLVLHFIFSANKSVGLSMKTFLLVIGIGLFISLGNFGIIEAYSLGASQSIFTIIFYIALIIYGILFGLLIWHERLNYLQGLGVLIAIAGLLMIVYFKK